MTFEVCLEELDDGWAVVFRRFRGTAEVIGVPLRGVTRAEAQKALAPLRYAFEYGLYSRRLEHVDVVQLEVDDGGQKTQIHSRKRSY